MQFSQSLKGFSLFANGTDFGGTITKGKVVMPKRTLADRKPGGTNLTMRTQHGWELDPLELSVAGATAALFSLAAGRRIDGQQMVLRGAYEDEFDGNVYAAEIEAWGRAEETDFFGEWQADEDSEGKIVFVPARYKVVYGGQERAFFNVRTGVVRMNGEDVTEPVRAALGRA